MWLQKLLRFPIWLIDFQLDFPFDCLRKEDLTEESLLNHSVAKEGTVDGDCYLDENEGGEVPSFVAVITCNSYKLAYIIKIFEKSEASEEDRYGHSIAPGKLFLRGSYLKPERSWNISQTMFSVVPGNVFCDPDEVFEVFVDIDSDLLMSKDAYLALVARSS